MSSPMDTDQEDIVPTTEESNTVPERTQILTTCESLQEVIKKLSKLSMGKNNDDEFVNTLKNVSYLSSECINQMQDIIQPKKEINQTTSSHQEEMTSFLQDPGWDGMNESVMNKLKERFKEATQRLQQVQRLTQEKDQEVKKLKCIAELTVLKDSFQSATSLVEEMARLSQAEPSTPTIPLGSSTERAAKRQKPSCSGVEAGGPSRKLINLYENASNDHITKLMVLRSIDRSLDKMLKNVSDKFSVYMLSSNHPVDKNKTTTTSASTQSQGKSSKKEISKTTKLDMKTALDSFFEDKNDQKNGILPFLISNEINMTHPVLEKLLNLISGQVKQWETDQCETDQCETDHLSPAKSRVACERTISHDGYGRRHQRKVDIVIAKEGKFFLSMPDESIQICFETKPVFRQKTTMADLQFECLEHVVGSMAKFIYKGLNFHQRGLSCYITSLTGNVLFVRIHRLELNISEQKVDVSLSSTPELPLLTKDAFTHLFEKSIENEFLDEKKIEELKELKETLYPVNYDVNATPEGIVAIAKIMISRTNEHRGFQLPGIKVLGSGTFGLVVTKSDEQETEQNFVYKLPLSVDYEHIDHERKILKELGLDNQNCQDGGRTNLPCLHDKKFFEIKLGSVLIEIPCLQLSPQGRRIDMCKMNVISYGKFYKGIKAALQYVHSKGFFHNDVSPKNILVSSERVVLVDFDVASKTGDDIYGFVGTPMYAHDEIFNNFNSKSWFPQKKYDFFGLYLSLAAVASEDNKLWNMDGFPCSITKENKNDLKEVLEKRKKKADGIIDNIAELSEEEIKEIKEIASAAETEQIKEISNAAENE